MFKHIINKIKGQVRSWDNNCNKDGKWLLSLPNKEMTQVDKNTNFSKKNGQRT